MPLKIAGVSRFKAPLFIPPAASLKKKAVIIKPKPVAQLTEPSHEPKRTTSIVDTRSDVSKRQIERVREHKNNGQIRDKGKIYKETNNNENNIRPINGKDDRVKEDSSKRESQEPKIYYLGKRKGENSKIQNRPALPAMEKLDEIPSIKLDEKQSANQDSTKPRKSIVFKGVELASGQLETRRHIHRIDKRMKKPHWICDSVAGSGKSFTILFCAEEIKTLYPDDDVLVLQFNKHIKEASEAALKHIKGVDVLTNSGAGWRILKAHRPRMELKKNKYFGIAKGLCETHYGALSGNIEDPDLHLASQDNGSKKESKARQVLQMTLQLTEVMEMCMNTLTNPEDSNALHAMVHKYGMNIKYKGVIELVNACIDRGIEMYEQLGIIDFIDMLYLPLCLNLPCIKYKWILCDECQDFNAAQAKLIKMHLAKGGRIGYFGDERQSIMAWCGAMPDSIEAFITKMNARKIPLSVCYRCPSKVLDLARLIVPWIENRPNCPEGIIEAIPYYRIASEAGPGDYVLCRLTAPLVKMCIEFIKINKRAKVKGKDIEMKLKGLYDNVAESGGDDVKTVDQFIGYIKDYALQERKSMLAKKMTEMQVAQIEDCFAAIKAIGEYYSSKHHNSLGRYGNAPHKTIKDQITWMFSDTVPEDFITLSTVHKAKGLQADNIFIIHFDKLPFKPGGKKKGEEMNIPTFSKVELQQELNLMYVAITRPKKALYICGNGINSYKDVESHVKNWVAINKSLQEGESIERINQRLNDINITEGEESYIETQPVPKEYPSFQHIPNSDFDLDPQLTEQEIERREALNPNPEIPF